MINYITRIFNWFYHGLKRLFDSLFGSFSVEPNTEASKPDKSQSVVLPVANKYSDAREMLARLSDVSGEMELPHEYRRILWHGSDAVIGYCEMQANAKKMDDEAWQNFCENNIRIHRQSKGLDWYIAPSPLGRLFNLGDVTLDEQTAIKQNKLVRSNFLLFFKAFVALNHDVKPADIYGVRIEKLYRAAFVFFDFRPDELGDDAQVLFDKYKAHKAVPSRYLKDSAGSDQSPQAFWQAMGRL